MRQSNWQHDTVTLMLTSVEVWPHPAAGQETILFQALQRASPEMPVTRGFVNLTIVIVMFKGGNIGS